MNKVVHFEVPFDNQERATTFYKDVFGWEINKMSDMPYWMCHTVKVDEQFMPTEAGAINGGMYERNTDFPKTPVIVVEVPDCEAHVKKVEAAGGKRLSDVQKVGDMGLYAYVEDTEGNPLGVWQTLKQ